MTNPAEGYERFMVPTLFGPWANRLIDRATPLSRDRTLDVACGTGIAARLVASRRGPGALVAGLDASPNMLAVARAAAAREGARIQWLSGSAERLPFPSQSFDLVICQFALMFFRDRRAAISEMARVASNRGRIAVSVWQGLNRHPFYQTLHKVIQDRLGISALQDIFSLGDTAELRAPFESAGFEQISIVSPSMTARFPDPAGFLAGEIDVDTAAIPSMQQADDETRQRMVKAIAADMRAPLQDVTRGGQVVIDFYGHILTARPRARPTRA